MSKRMPHIGIGTASLIVIFAVLSLTVFSMLALMTARNEKILAERTADNVQAYYEADTQAVHIRRAVEQAIQAGTMPDSVDGIALERSEEEVRYTCPAGDSLKLAVVLALVPDGATRVRTWQTEPAGDWQADTSIQVWDGEGA